MLRPSGSADIWQSSGLQATAEIFRGRFFVFIRLYFAFRGAGRIDFIRRSFLPGVRAVFIGVRTFLLLYADFVGRKKFFVRFENCVAISLTKSGRITIIRSEHMF